MGKTVWKKYGFGIMTAILLSTYTGIALLDTFVIPHEYGTVAEREEISASESTAKAQNQQQEGKSIARVQNQQQEGQSEARAQNQQQEGQSEAQAQNQQQEGQSEAQVQNQQQEGQSEARAQNQQQDHQEASYPIITENSYESESISIVISEYRVSDTTAYVADIVLNGDASLQTAMAKDTYGKNVKEATSEIAQAHDAILAVNGDFYGARNAGYVIREGVLYRSSSAGNEDLVIYQDGSFEIIQEGKVTAQELLEKGAWNVLSFGPALVIDGEIAVTADEEVGRAMASNPRTAIGVLEDGHYLMVVSDGRTSASAGLSLRELALFLQELGAKTAYNLDGGGSSTMVFMGEVVNNPTTGGKRIGERSVSDIVYVGES